LWANPKATHLSFLILGYDNMKVSLSTLSLLLSLIDARPFWNVGKRQDVAFDNTAVVDVNGFVSATEDEPVAGRVPSPILAATPTKKPKNTAIAALGICGGYGTCSN